MEKRNQVLRFLFTLGAKNVTAVKKLHKISFHVERQYFTSVWGLHYILCNFHIGIPKADVRDYRNYSVIVGSHDSLFGFFVLYHILEFSLYVLYRLI